MTRILAAVVVGYLLPGPGSCKAAIFPFAALGWLILSGSELANRIELLLVSTLVTMLIALPCTLLRMIKSPILIPATLARSICEPEGVMLAAVPRFKVRSM